MKLNAVDGAIAEKIRSGMAPELFRDPDPRYLEEPRDTYRGQAGLLALPRNTQEVADLIRRANALRVGVVPYGGGTGLVAAQVMPEGPAPLVLSLERMSAIRGLYPAENVIVADAGTVLADIQAAAQNAGRLFPLSLASEGSCRIGGNLSTNAGGVNVLRYGNARDLCLGLEAVLPDGSVLNGLTRLRKDNTGYDLRNLLVGAEGTLGVITAAALKLVPVPSGRGTAIFEVPSPQAALDLLTLARDRLGEAVSAFELMHANGFEFLKETLPELRQPWPEPPEWCVLIELGLARGLDPADALETLFAEAVGRDLATDGLIATSETQARDFWNLRETIPEANRKVGSVSSHDISLPLGAIPEFIRTAPGRIKALGAFRINCFGHLGDGNLHYNVFPQKGHSRADHDNVRGAVKRAVHDLVDEMEGSISAEHGIGRAKLAELERYGDPVKLAAMRGLKAALDPNGIMNPGAVIRAD